MIWMIVSKDKYEFPLGVYDTATELAMAVGTSTNCVMATVNKFEKGKLKWSKYRRIREEEDDEEPN